MYFQDRRSSMNSIQGNARINGHMNLVAISRGAGATPPEQRKKREVAKKRRETESTYSTSGIARPETAEEFLSLDFSSRCAIAGLQLGKTKVFLRREAFDRIEALRAQKFGKSATAIQKIVRGCQTRRYVKMLKAQMTMAAIIIQRAYSNYVDRLFYLEMNETLIPSAVKIQAVARGANTRTWYFETLYSAMRVQAIVRGHQARTRVAKLRHGPVASVQSSFDSNTFIGTFDENDMSPNKLVPFEKCQAVVEISSEWAQLRNLVGKFCLFCAV